MTLISVLSKAEAKEFDEPPVFNSIDRKRFYNLNVILQNTIDKLRTPNNYALIVLQKGNVLVWKHILLLGEYDLRHENTNDEFGLMDPKIIALIYTKFWET